MKMNGTVGYAQLERGHRLPPLYADPSDITLPPLYGTQDTSSSSRNTSESDGGQSSSQDNSPDKTTPTTDQPVVSVAS